jgi:hypothetical protein
MLATATLIVTNARPNEPPQLHVIADDEGAMRGSEVGRICRQAAPRRQTAQANATFQWSAG